MVSRLPFTLAVAGVIGAGVLMAVINADAQQPPPVNPPAAAVPGALPGPARQPLFSAQDRAAFLDARIAALHAGLQLTPDQEKLWPAVETAFRDTAKMIAEQRQKLRDEPRPSDPVAWLRRISDNTTARGETLKKLADAAAPLYATLSDEQKRRLPVLLHALRPRFMHQRMAMMGGERGGPMGGGGPLWHRPGRDGEPRPPMDQGQGPGSCWNRR
jgi:zinc resistance-associated protein